MLLNPLAGLGHVAVVGGVLRALRAEDPRATAIVVSGGVPIPPGLLPGEVDLVQLPGLLPSEGLFAGLAPRAEGLTRAAVRKIRTRMVAALVKTFRPDVVVVEHYPFGRHAFAKELETTLAEIAARLPAARIAGSLSVLGGRAPEHRREPTVLEAARRHFHRLLVHVDPALERLDDDYPTIAPALAPLVRYTGYVVPRLTPTAAEREAARARLGVAPGERLLLAHAGGGRDGARLLRLALETAPELAALFGPRWRTVAVSGAALPEAEAAALERLARSPPCPRPWRSRWVVSSRRPSEGGPAESADDGTAPSSSAPAAPLGSLRGVVHSLLW
jgi:predicted glycosyltransferase